MDLAGFLKMESDGVPSLASDPQLNSQGSVHMQLLERSLLKTTGKCVSSFKSSLLKQQFQHVYKKDPKLLQQLHEDAVTELNVKIQEEIAVMFEEENIFDFMVKLDELTDKTQIDVSSSGASTAWRPSGCPTDDLCAHVQSVHHQHLGQLYKILDQLQSQNSLLHQSVKKYHEKVVLSKKTIAENCQTWKQVSCLSQEEHEELETFIKCFGQNTTILP